MKNVLIFLWWLPFVIITRFGFVPLKSFKFVISSMCSRLLIYLLHSDRSHHNFCWSTTSYLLCFIMEVPQQTPRQHHSSSSPFPPTQWCLSYKQSEPSQDLLVCNKFLAMLYHGSATTGVQTSLLQLTLSSNSMLS